MLCSTAPYSARLLLPPVLRISARQWVNTSSDSRNSCRWNRTRASLMRELSTSAIAVLDTSAPTCACHGVSSDGTEGGGLAGAAARCRATKLAPGGGTDGGSIAAPVGCAARSFGAPRVAAAEARAGDAPTSRDDGRSSPRAWETGAESLQLPQPASSRLPSRAASSDSEATAVYEARDIFSWAKLVIGGRKFDADPARASSGSWHAIGQT